jgi:RNA polymerase sigma-70 factor, ECF subfamily
VQGTRDDSVMDLPDEDASDPSTTRADAAVEEVRLAVARAVRKVCPRWLAGEADDLAQTVVARVLARVAATAGQAAFKPGYFYKAAHSALVDEIRRRRRLREVPMDGTPPMASRLSNAERRAEGREIRDALAACMSGLVESRRRAVMLHLQDHSAAEVGALLDCGQKKAENLIYRGLADLRACLKARGVTP